MDVINTVDSSNNYFQDKDNITINQDTKDLTLLQNGEIYSTEDECIYDGPFNISNPEDCQGLELTDFEELIDSTLSFNNKILKQDIKDFEFETFLETDTEDKEELSLVEVSDYVEQIITEGNYKNIQTVHIVDNSEIKVNYATESNDEPTYIDLTTNSEEISAKDQQEIILISDDDAESISSDGYHSTDFEFITEEEAKIVGLLDNFNGIKRGNQTNFENANKIELETNESHEDRIKKSIESGGTHSESAFTNHVSLSGHLSDPGEGPSCSNESIHDYSDGDYPQNHIMPEGDGYLELFQGPFNPVLSMADIILLENKSIRPSPMNIQYEGMGFDKQLVMQRCDADSSDDEFADEAKESIKKIMSMYPDYNRHLRRRRF